MARTVRDTKLGKPAERARLDPRGKPYWRVLESGLHLGYRRAKTSGGSWTARRFIGQGKYLEHGLGCSDDLQEADGITVLSFSQAQAKAREWWKASERAGLGIAPVGGPCTVAMALDAYFADRERRGSKGLPKDRAAAKARILPSLGNAELAKVTTKRLRDWHTGLAVAPKLVRTSRIVNVVRKNRAVDMKDADAVRARRATANRTLTVLKAAFTRAFHEGLVTSDEAWRKVKPFREADAPVIRFLSVDECRRIVNATQGRFRDLVRGALVTGARYGELIRMRCEDFNEEVGTITIRVSKAGKARHVVLANEGRALFELLTAGRAPQDLIFARDDNAPWGASHQTRPIGEASRIAKLDPPATFHVLRHTYASALAMKGVPLGVIAAQLGHSDTRMTDAHLSPSYVADVVRAALPTLGIVDNTNVERIKARP